MLAGTLSIEDEYFVRFGRAFQQWQAIEYQFGEIFILLMRPENREHARSVFNQINSLYNKIQAIEALIELTASTKALKKEWTSCRKKAEQFNRKHRNRLAHWAFVTIYGDEPGEHVVMVPALRDERNQSKGRKTPYIQHLSVTELHQMTVLFSRLRQRIEHLRDLVFEHEVLHRQRLRRQKQRGLARVRRQKNSSEPLPQPVASEG